MEIQEIRARNDWDKILKEEFSKQYFIKLWDTVLNEYKNYMVYPEINNIFNAFKLTPYGEIKAVILGQDPYHNPGQAEGLAFSVPKGCPLPPSLINIFKELKNDLGIEPPQSGSLGEWGKRGVLLLNTVLTVREGQANSHKDIGWEIFTDNIIKKISQKKIPVVFILWGNYARSKKSLIDTSLHYIVESPHPSPLSASSGFFNSKPFSKTNRFLGRDAIDWKI